jgi:competence protein ComEC
LRPDEKPPGLLSYGQTVEMSGTLQQPPPALNPGQFDYAQYLKTKGIPYVLYVPAGRWQRVERADPCGWFFMDFSCRLRRWAQERLFNLLPFPQNALLDGILLGERGALPGEMVEAFMETGTVHILAVSGMITAFIAGVLFILLRACQIPRKGAAGLTLAGILFFIGLTGAHPPVCRAGLFAVLALLAVIFEKRVHGGALLLTTAWVLVMVNPFVLQDLSFQISFLATAGLMVLGRRLESFLRPVWEPVRGLLAATAAAQVSVWCLLIYSFNQLSLYSLIANLFIVPLALFSVAAGLAAVAASCLAPFLGTLFAAGCDVVLRLLVILAQWINGWPGANFIVASPDIFWMITFHALLLITFYFTWPRTRPEKPSEEWNARFRSARLFQRILVWIWVGFLVIYLGVGVMEKTGLKSFKVMFFSAGHGDAALLETPSEMVFALEGGWLKQGLPRYQTTVAYMRHMGLSRVEGVVNLSPVEEDVGGLAQIVKAFPVSHAYGVAGDYPETWGCQAFLDALSDQNVSLYRLQKGDEVPDMEGAELKVLYAPALLKRDPARAPNRSIAVLLTIPTAGRKLRILFPGNLGEEASKEIEKFVPVGIHPDWLVAPRHGAWSADQRDWASRLKPSFIVISDSKAHPEDEEIYKSANPSSKVFCTARDGSVEIEINSNDKKRYSIFSEGKWHFF